MKANEKDISNSSEAWEKHLEENLQNTTSCCPHVIVEDSRESFLQKDSRIRTEE